MKRSLFILALFSSFGLLLITSCKTDPKATSAATVEEEPFVVNSRIRAEPDRLNPVMTWRAWSIQINNHLFANLVEFEPQKLELMPMLVKSRPVINPITEGPYKGGVSYDYEMLEEAVWDNGKPVLASDYVFSIKAVMNPKTGGAAPVFRSYFSLIKDVEIDPTNPRKFRVIIHPAYIRGEYLSGGFGILPESIYDPEGLMREFELKDLNDPKKAEQLAKDNPNMQKFADAFSSDKYSREIVSGAGAYKLAEWTSGERVVLEKKKDWWGDKLADKYPMLTANPDKIIYRPISDPTATISLMRNQEIDVAAAIPNNMFIDLQKDEALNKDHVLLAPDTYTQNFIVLNTRAAKLNDKRVRRALAHLLDMDEVIKTVKAGMASPILGPISQGHEYANKKLKLISLDVEKAKKLLTDAGWKDTNNNGIVDKVIDGQLEEMKLGFLMSPNNEVSANIALIFQVNAKKAGVEINIQTEEANTAREKIKKHDFEMFSVGSALDADFYDPHQVWHTSNDVPGGSNRAGFGDAKTDALIEKLRRSLDSESRYQLYMEFQEILYDEQPVIFMYNTKDCMIFNKRLANAKPSLRSPGYFENFFELRK